MDSESKKEISLKSLEEHNKKLKEKDEERNIYCATYKFLKKLYSSVLSEEKERYEINQKEIQNSNFFQSDLTKDKDIKTQRIKQTEDLINNHTRSHSKVENLNLYLLPIHKEDNITHVLKELEEEGKINYFIRLYDKKNYLFFSYVVKIYLQLTLNDLSSTLGKNILSNLNDIDDLTGINLNWYKEKLKYRKNEKDHSKKREINFLYILLKYYKKLQKGILEENFPNKRQELRILITQTRCYKNCCYDEKKRKNKFRLGCFVSCITEDEPVSGRELFDFVNLNLENNNFSILKILRKAAEEDSINFNSFEPIYKIMKKEINPCIEKLLSILKSFKEAANFVRNPQYEEYIFDYSESLSIKTFTRILRIFEILKLYENNHDDKNTEKFSENIRKYKLDYNNSSEAEIPRTNRFPYENSNETTSILNNNNFIDEFISKFLEIKLQEIQNQSRISDESSIDFGEKRDFVEDDIFAVPTEITNQDEILKSSVLNSTELNESNEKLGFDNILFHENFQQHNNLNYDYSYIKNINLISKVHFMKFNDA